MARGSIYNELPFPLGGVNVANGFTHQPKGTVYDALNVRGYDPTTNALRGAQRCGHTKYLSGTLNGSKSIQNINHVMVSAAINPVSGASSRTLTGVAVAGGNVMTFVRGGLFAAVTNGTAALNATNPFIQSTLLISKIYYADGVVFKYYDPSINTVVTMSPSAGSLPVDSFGNAPRLVCTWRGRLVYSGLIGDPQNWFMSAQFAPLNWDYSPALTSATMAVAGNNTEAGLIPDNVQTMIPYNDDLLIFGSDHAMWQMTEDPAAGGQIDRITDTVGIAWGDSWCKDSQGNVWFIGSRGGLYAFHPSPGMSAAPVRISSQSVDEKLLTIDFNANYVRLVWDDRFQAVMIYITPIAGGATTNWVYDTRSEAFWPDSFTNTNHQPTAVHLMDGDNPSDRVVLLGGFDGSIRFIDLNAIGNDDGTAISSYVKLGPIQGQGAKLRLNELVVVMGEKSGNCNLDIFAGHSAEAAFNSGMSRFPRVIGAGRSEAIRPATTGQAMFIKIANSTLNKAWQFEAMYAVLESLGRAAARQL